MTQQTQKPSFFKGFFMWFLVFYTLMIGYQYFFGEKQIPSEEIVSSIIIKPFDNDITIGNLAVFNIHNESSTPIEFSSPCETETKDSLKIFFVSGHGNKKLRSDISSEIFTKCTAKDISSFEIPAGETTDFKINNFNQELFSDEGFYEIEMQFNQGEETKTIISEQIEIETPGAFRQLFRAIISRPIFNALVFFKASIPHESYGWAIIIVTFIIRLFLFIPNQKAMRSQREMQKLQPKIAELKEKYKDNKQTQALKTMELYKTHHINPMASLVPILFQMPVLIGLYYLIRDGISPHLEYLLYGFYKNADISVSNDFFFGIDLGSNGPIYLAIMVGLIQFALVKLSMFHAKKHSGDIVKPKKSNNPMDQMQHMSKMMMFIMPLMVGFFTMSLPAGVGLYWLASTTFGIGQQLLVNHRMDQPKVRKI